MDITIYMYTIDQIYCNCMQYLYVYCRFNEFDLSEDLRVNGKCKVTLTRLL